ncbi:MAG: hypothetical protein D6729_08650 [Deltaproteobacteria bacterium]|nr:MAG: hypothetical protein D6729_08650 [Deltaproteobacteria bacterium]
MKQALFILGLAAAFGLMAYGTYLAFYVAPIEAQMGFIQKIFYFHVPVAWNMFLGVGIAAGASIWYLVTRKESADRAAWAAAELGALFGLMVMVTGPLWAWKAWGRPWVWDVRLTSSLLVWLIMLAYLAVRSFGGPSARSLAAGLAIFAVVQVPLIYYSVDIWRGTHPQRLVAKGALEPEMRAALYTCAFGFLALFFTLYAVRLGVGRARAEMDALYLLAEEAGLEEG